MDRRLERRLGAALDIAAPPSAVEAVEGKRLDRLPDGAHGTGVERDVVRKAVHEAHPAAIHRRHGDVAGEQRAAAARPCPPMQDSAAGKMPAGPDKHDIAGDAMALPRPWHDGGMRPCDPLAVVT